MKARYFLMCAATAIVCLSGAVVDAGTSGYGSLISEARVRDNSWTRGVHEKYHVSEIELQSALTTRTLFEAEGTGFEPASNSEVNDNTCCIYVNCDEGCAANALHSDFLKCLEMALNDTDLQNIIGSWDQLPNEIRKAIAVLIKANEIKKKL